MAGRSKGREVFLLPHQTWDRSPLIRLGGSDRVGVENVDRRSPGKVATSRLTHGAAFPSLPTPFGGGIAQLVEHQAGSLRVTGSNPVTSTT